MITLWRRPWPRSGRGEERVGAGVMCDGGAQRGLGVGRGRGVGVHLPVHGVGVAVGVDVGVGVAVGVTVGVGVGVPPPGVTTRLSTIKIGP